MVYFYELDAGRRVYLDNPGMQTIITITSETLGQQQQSSSGLQTGSWTQPPQMFLTSHGMIVKLMTAQGEHYINIHGSQVSMVEALPTLTAEQAIPMHQVAQMPSLQPMPLMEPMKMGNMEMNLNPMTMKMGNMEMKMGSPSQQTKRFCSQCGTKVGLEDRFCSSCGHRLKD